MASPEGFYAVPASVFPVGGNECLVLNRRDGSVRHVDALAARALGCCQGVRPLEVHAAAMLRAGVSANPAAIAKAIEQLLSLELLRGWTWRAPESPANAEPGEIDTVAIVTADRPKMVARCLDAIIRHCRRWHHAPRLLVVDGSRHEADATRQAACHAATEAPGPVEYLGQTEADHLRRAFAGEHIPADVLDFALTPGEIGANRNLALLSTVGERVLMVDDDVLLEPWALEEAKDGIALVGHDDPREWRFFETRQAALDATHRVDIDLLTAHGSLLGRHLGDLLTQNAPDLDVACHHMVTAAENPGDLTISLTFAGLAGDSARYCATRLLLSSGRLRQRLYREPRSLELATTTREAHSIPAQLSITHHTACLAYCMGMSNADGLVPFLPVGRNEDGVFGMTLQMTGHRSLAAHLPCGVLHDSTRPSFYTADELARSARQVRASDVLLSLISLLRSVYHSAIDIDHAESLSEMGRIMIALSDIDTHDLAVLAAEAELRSRSYEFIASRNYCDTIGASNTDDRCATILHAYRTTFLDRIRRCRSWPFDDYPPHATVAWFQSLLRSYGHLLAHWRSLCNTTMTCATPSYATRL
jgi:hypothetical protein